MNNFQKLVEESLDEYYFAQVNFEVVRQGFIDLAGGCLEMLAKAICRDLEDVMSLTGSREWRDTDDPYMDAVCDTIVDYMKNDIKEFLDPEYIKELLKHCVVRVISLYATALLTPSRKKCSINDKFFSRLQLGKQILYDFGMEYVTFEKVCSFILKGMLPNAP